MCRCVDISARPHAIAGGMAASLAAQQQQQQAKVKAQNPADDLDAFMTGVWQENATWGWGFPTGLECAQSPTDESQADTVVKNSPTNEVWSPAEPEGLNFDANVNFFDDEGVENDSFFIQLAAECNMQLEAATALPMPQQFQQQEYIAPAYEQPAPVVEQKPNGEFPVLVQHPIELDDFSFPKAASTALKPCPRRAPHHKSDSPTESSSDDSSDAKLCKWKRRDIAKHLAGERNRRAKRMDKVHILQALVAGLPAKPTVNQILAAAIERIKAVKAEAASSSSNTKGAVSPSSALGLVSMRDAMRCSASVPCMVLDENHCVVEASPSMLRELSWPGDEESIKGQYIASIMHPDDACALINEACVFRSVQRADSTVQVVRMSLALMEFAPMAGLDGYCAFPRGFKDQRLVNCTINNKTTFIAAI